MSKFRDQLLEVQSYAKIRFPKSHLVFDVPISSIYIRNDSKLSVAGEWTLKLVEDDKVLLQVVETSGEDAMKLLSEKLRVDGIP